MSRRDTFLAAFSGATGSVTVAWGNDPVSHAVVMATSERTSDQGVLVEVLSPYFGLPIDFQEISERDPVEADLLLCRERDRVLRSIAAAEASGADGVAYMLGGASPGSMSPMMYGGHFLELDREILQAVPASLKRMVFVVGGVGTYIDFVSDLPAEAFGWDIDRSGIPIDAVRAMRAGVLATTDPLSDIVISSPVPSTTQLENHRIGTTV